MNTYMATADRPCPRPAGARFAHCSDGGVKPLRAAISSCYRSVDLRREAIFHVILGLPYLLVMTRFVWPLDLPLTVKVGAGLILLAGSQYHLLSKLSSGSVFDPEFPRPLVIALNWLFGTLIFLALMQLLLDAATLLAMPFAGSVTVSDSFRYAMAALAGVLAAIGVRQAIRVPALKDVEVRIAALPQQFDGYRLLHLTDLHISKLFPRSWTEAVVERSTALGADVILITGDVIDGALDARRDGVAPLGNLKAPDGIYLSPGNHEYYFGYQAWMDHFATLGLRVLENEHVVIERDGGKLVVAGVTDRTAKAFGLPGPDTAGAIADAPKDAPVVLLDHQPRNARRAAELGVALQLSGHTHGGMIPGLARLVARSNAGYVSGHYDVVGMTLYVNNATGLWPGFALRLGCPSELTRITLRAR